MSQLQFVSEDVQSIVSELIAEYERATGKTLYPAQSERLLIDLIAYRESLVRSSINETGRQCLVAFAREPFLDYLGELVGCQRLDAQSAKTSMRIVFSDTTDALVTIPAGTRFETAGGIQFASDEEILVPAGSASFDIPATAIDAGTSGNAYLPGQISLLVDDLDIEIDSVSNISTTTDGTDRESDDRYRERIKLAPEAFSCAGCRDAYIYHTKSAHQSIVDVAITRPESGVVKVSPLTSGGLPSATLLATVSDALSAEKVRPLNDIVDVKAPVEVTYSITASITVYSGYDSAAVLAASSKAVDDFVALKSKLLGQDIVPTQIVNALSVDGIYDVLLESPNVRQIVDADAWAHCTSISVALEGVSNG